MNNDITNDHKFHSGKSHLYGLNHTVAVRLEIQTLFLTWLLVQDLLKLGPLVLHGLLHEVRPQALDGEVNHVGLHQAQDTEDLPEGRAGELVLSETSFVMLYKKKSQTCNN